MTKETRQVTTEWWKRFTLRGWVDLRLGPRFDGGDKKCLLVVRCRVRIFLYSSASSSNQCTSHEKTAEGFRNVRIGMSKRRKGRNMFKGSSCRSFLMRVRENLVDLWPVLFPPSFLRDYLVKWRGVKLCRSRSFKSFLYFSFTFMMILAVFTIQNLCLCVCVCVWLFVGVGACVCFLKCLPGPFINTQ